MESAVGKTSRRVAAKNWGAALVRYLIELQWVVLIGLVGLALLLNIVVWIVGGARWKTKMLNDHAGAYQDAVLVGAVLDVKLGYAQAYEDLENSNPITACYYCFQLSDEAEELTVK